MNMNIPEGYGEVDGNDLEKTALDFGLLLVYKKE